MTNANITLGGYFMTAVVALEKLLTVNRNAAVLILTGVAVFAAISIVGTYEIDYSIAIRVAAYIFGFATVAIVLSVVVDNTLIRTVLGWFVVALFMFWSAALSFSIVFQPGPLPPPYCLVYFLQDCDDLAEAIALRKSQRDAPATLPTEYAGPGVDQVNPDPVADVPGDAVFVQFAGVITRDSVRAMMLALQAKGWNVQGATGGGERTSAASGHNEVRYSGDSLDAARLLAAELEKINLTGRPIHVVENPDVAADALEVWLSIV
jgi:hypothetical protein